MREINENTMLCQACGALNDEDREYCFRCQNKLLVLSGLYSAFDEEMVEEYEDEEELSLDEHLLERISALEEIVKRSAEALRAALDSIQNQERAIFVNQTGLLSIKELLERRNLLPGEEILELWESKMGERMLALEKKERFAERRDRMLSLFHGSRNDRFRELIEEAGHMIEAFEQERAMKLLEEAFKLDRQNYELSFFLGEMYFNEGRLDRAQLFLETTLEAQPDHFDAAVLYGVLLHERSELEGAEHWLRRAIEISQDSFIPYFSLGAIYALQGEYISAQRYLEEAIEIEPLPQAHYLLGTIFYEKGPISTRAAYNWRSDFLITPRDDIFPFSPIWQESTGQLDASFFYAVTDYLKLGVQGVNLLDEVTETSQVIDFDGTRITRSAFRNDR
ncbi:MAG: tetratricopeptide repeat protein, partial [Thermoanaerobaculia bacterium]|nr:tetratricopeptide repeat protein [Thermoanaerobaculia bacterium]